MISVAIGHPSDSRTLTFTFGLIADFTPLAGNCHPVRADHSNRLLS